MKLRRTKFDKHVLIAFLINLILNFEGSIPAWFFLAMHFIFGWSIWFFVIALAIWVLGIMLWMFLIGWASSCSTPDPPKEKKNPYSAKNQNK